MRKTTATNGNDRPMRVYQANGNPRECLRALEACAAEGRFPIYVRMNDTNDKCAIFDEGSWEALWLTLKTDLRASKDWEWSTDYRFMLGC